MLISLRWLEEMIGTPLDIKKLKKDALSLGLEVEDVLHCAPEFLLIGKIISAKPHPRRKNLQVLQIKTDQEITIVSADMTITTNDRVLVCPVNATFKDEMVSPRNLAGITSEGMLVSEQELGLAEHSTGVIVLDKGTAGDRFAACFDDIILDMSTTPNRPDWLSVDGIARDLAVRLDIDYRTRSFMHGLHTTSQTNKRGSFNLELRDKQGCPRYTARLFKDVNVQESPFSIKWRLHCMGMNAVNNIVDTTNVIMLLTGQPLHPFDYDLLEGGIIIRKARPNESFITLEGTKIKLNSDDCVIADAQGPVALAGIIGSQRGQISNNTKRIILESAYFNPRAIAHTSRRLNVITEASMRFERGGDIHVVDAVSDLTGQWFKKYRAATEYQFVSKGKKGKPSTISFTAERLNEILALDLKKTAIKKLLKKANIKVTGTGTFTAHVPHYRRDLCIKEDIFEEVARIFGYMKIPETMPKRWGGRVAIDPDKNYETTIRKHLIGQGFSETYNLSLIASDQLMKMGFNNFNTLKNPLNERFDALRPTLFTGLVESVNYNLSKGNRSLKLFEIGNILLTRKPFQERRIGIILGGLRYPDHWEKQNEQLDYYDAKGVVENLARVLHVRNIAFEVTSKKGFTQVASISIAGKELGYLGIIAPDICKEPYYYVEFSLEKFLAARSETCYMTPAKFPANTRDLSFLVDHSVKVPHIMASIRTIGGPILERVTLFDRYKGKNIPDGCINIGFRLYFRAPDRTLNDKEVDRFVSKIEHEITKRYNAKLRKKE